VIGVSSDVGLQGCSNWVIIRADLYVHMTSVGEAEGKLSFMYSVRGTCMSIGVL